MLWLFLILLIGLNAAPFILHSTDIWHAQGLWAQTWIMVIFACSFFVNQKSIKVKNKPLAGLTIWLTLMTFYVAYLLVQSQKYPTHNLYPLLNFSCMLILYKSILGMATEEMIEKILMWLKYAVIFTLFVCVLQRFNLDQYFKLYWADHNFYSKSLNCKVFGFLGNGTHFSGFLACSIPLFLYKFNRESALALVLTFIILFYTGTTVGDPSMAGFAVGSILLLTHFFRLRCRTGFLFLALLLLLAYVLYLHGGNFLRDNGRIDWWTYYWNAWRKSAPVQGIGLGRIFQIHSKTPFPGIAHLHLEYFHFLVETGIIGFGLICWVVHDFLTRPIINDTHFCLYLMFLGFLVSCLFNYSAHLWMPSVWATFAYASFMAIENIEIQKYYD